MFWSEEEWDANEHRLLLREHMDKLIGTPVAAQKTGTWQNKEYALILAEAICHLADGCLLQDTGQLSVLKLKQPKYARQKTF